jgi:hypothetical protein
MKLESCLCGITMKSADNPLGICRVCRVTALERARVTPRRRSIDWKTAMVKYLPWLLSAVTVYMNVLAGDVAPHTWAVGLVGQAGWLVWIVATRNWGFLPMNIALWVVYGRNHFLWGLA